jgi:ABC-type uncharacterized transport system fused permease/ATPase subunit
MLLQPPVDLSTLNASLNRIIGLRDSIQVQLDTVNKEITNLEQEDLLLEKVTDTIRFLIDREVTVGVKDVERLLTEGLQSVFTDQNLSVKAEVDMKKKGKVSVDLITEQSHASGHPSPLNNISGPSNDAFGGAVATVQSILLRVILILRRGLHPVLFLDETLPAFDDKYVLNMAQFLSELCKKLGMDILLVTHNDALVRAADKAYRIVKSGDEATFEELLLRRCNEN